MGQCTCILPDGRRCSNPALPGARFCAAHKNRDSSRRIAGGNLPPSDPRLSESALSGPVSSGPGPAAVPRAAGTAPLFPGLILDERGIPAGPAGLALLAPSREVETPRLFSWLTRLLASLSRRVDMARCVRIWRRRGQGWLVRISPPENTVHLSHLYDAVAADVESGGGRARFYVGEDRAFIRYRDRYAPAGYDASLPDHLINGAAGRGDWLVADLEGITRIPADDLEEEPLADLMLRLPPGRSPIDGPPAAAYIMADAALYPRLARCFWDHGLECRLARIRDCRNRSRVIWRLSSRDGGPAPDFVLAHAISFPRVAVFMESGAEDGRMLLVERGWRHPCHRILGVFPEDAMICFGSGRDFPSEVLHPAPVFLTDAETAVTGSPVFMAGGETPAAEHPMTKPVGARPVPPADTASASHALTLPVRMVAASGPVPPPSALLLDARELEWLGRLTRRIPPHNLFSHLFYRGRDHSVILGADGPVRDIPFGAPLRRPEGGRLFPPQGSRFFPDLPLELLITILGIRDGDLCFMTENLRLDIPESAFAPLSHALLAEPGRPRVRIQPGPDLSPPPPDGLGNAAVPDGSGEPAAGSHPPPASGEDRRPGGKKDSPSLELRRELCRLAEARRANGEFLEAAVCLRLAGDEAAAVCLRQAAELLS